MRPPGMTLNSACPECGMTFDEKVQKHINNIAQWGATVVMEYVAKTTVHYTLGFANPNIGIPEYVLVGVPDFQDLDAMDVASGFFKFIANDYLKKGMIPEDGDKIPGMMLEEKYVVVMKEVPYRKEFWEACFEMGVAVCRRVGMPEDFKVVQLCVPDKQMRYCWDEGFDHVQWQFLLSDAEPPVEQPLGN